MMKRFTQSWPATGIALGALVAVTVAVVGWIPSASAQEDGGGVDPNAPEVAAPPSPDPGIEDGPAAPAFNDDADAGGAGGGGAEGERVGNGEGGIDGAFAGDLGDAGAAFNALRADLNNQGFNVPLEAFEIFPDAVRTDIQSLVSELLPLLQKGREEDLSEFFDAQGDRIATVFDQLGLEPSADDLLNVPISTDSIKFPDEFENYQEYLDTLELKPFERDYMLRSHEIAEQYEDAVTVALADQEKVQNALEDYQSQLEELNERYAEQFREQFLESIERAGPDGRRPDIDR